MGTRTSVILFAAFLSAGAPVIAVAQAPDDDHHEIAQTKALNRGHLSQYEREMQRELQRYRSDLTAYDKAVREHTGRWPSKTRAIFTNGAPMRQP